MPDKERLLLLKKIFLTAATEEDLDRHSSLPQEYMAICRQLSRGEIVVLLAARKNSKRNEQKSKYFSASDWLNAVAEDSGLSFPELVESHELKLIGKHLLTGRTYSDQSGVRLGQHFRLTELARNFCEFVEQYDKG